MIAEAPDAPVAVPAHGQAPDPITDALLAARIFLMAPDLFGGMVLRGSSPARDALVEALGNRLKGEGRSVRRLPGHVDDERLLGGIDIAASLASGRPVAQTGLIDEAARGVLVAPMAERMEDGVAGRLAQRMDERGETPAPALILLDDSTDPDDSPPVSLIERLAFSCDLSASRVWQDVAIPEDADAALPDVAPLDDEALKALAGTAMALGVASLRPLLFANAAARGHAALAGRGRAIEADLSAAVRLVLAPRATRLPPSQQEEDPEPEQPDQPPPEPPEQDDPPDAPEKSEAEQSKDDRQKQQDELEEMLVEAAEAAIPVDLLEQLAKGNAPRRTGGASGTGQKKKAGMRGKPLGSRPGMPRGGARLALIDTLRAAVPWQAVRRKERAQEGRSLDAPILMRKEDLRIRRYEEKAPRVTIFAVDASGSAAAARLAEAKGAVELMLGQAYVTRSEVALIAFRGDHAELLLPPTRSLTRAKRALSGLPGGGGTPLASGLSAARECAESVIAKGRTASLVILTDGRGNIDANGQPGRAKAREDAEAAARAIAARGIDALVVDISPRPAREGPALAEAMRGRFLALPRADAKTLQGAITAAQGGSGPAR